MIIQKQIVSKINRAKCFSILADKTADVSGMEQFSSCARYYDEDLKKNKKRFFSIYTFYRCYCKRVSYKNIRNSKLFKYRKKIFKESRII